MKKEEIKLNIEDIKEAILFRLKASRWAAWHGGTVMLDCREVKDDEGKFFGVTIDATAELELLEPHEQRANIDPDWMERPKGGFDSKTYYENK